MSCRKRTLDAFAALGEIDRLDAVDLTAADISESDLRDGTSESSLSGSENSEYFGSDESGFLAPGEFGDDWEHVTSPRHKSMSQCILKATQGPKTLTPRLIPNVNRSLVPQQLAVEDERPEEEEDGPVEILLLSGDHVVVHVEVEEDGKELPD